MPNWCNNTLIINGVAEEVGKMNWQEEEKLLFAKLIPEPNNLEEVELQKWRLENWGCKWDCQVQVLDYSDDYREIQFDSPWNPPLAGILKLSTLFSHCVFELRYSEPGCNFQGHLLSENGVEQFHRKGTFFGRERPCPECGEIYAAELNLDGNIVYDYCYHCDSEF